MSENTKEERTRTITWEDPRAMAEAGRGLSGMEYLRKIVAGELPAPPIAMLMDFKIAELSEGHAVFVVEPAEYHYNPIGVVHGGLAATLLDSAMGCAVHSTLPEGASYTTLEIKVNYIRPMTAETGPVRCEAKVIHVGARTATAEGGSLMGVGSSTHTAPRHALFSDRDGFPGSCPTVRRLESGLVLPLGAKVPSLNGRNIRPRFAQADDP